MADPFRLRVLMALTALLQTITPANGFQFDFSDSVFRGRTKFGPNDPLPMLSILEAPIPLDQLDSAPEYGFSSARWELLIQGFCSDDIDNPTDPAHRLMAEVKQVLIEDRQKDRGHNILGMGGRVAQMSIGQGAVRPADEASDKGFFWLTVTLHIVEDLSKPYD